ncbi:isocitrate/isopropylmalate family dehydrogenase [Sphaerisporangium sp. NPDC051011]|uniref:isocitrate/isopropylmalate dehydrogenase family protein n=1 Tax=Sphaerisporangium sp. NPDC051011 TaxID=3155792 RepID=UPI0033D3EFE8
MSYTIAVIEGDGIGPELVRAATRVMDAAAAATGVELAYESVRAGADRFRETGSAVTPADMNRLREADGILKGPVGLPDVRHPDGTEAGLLGGILRPGLDAYANIRPIRQIPGVPTVTTWRPGEIDYVIVRENTEGLYLSRGLGVGNDQACVDQLFVSRHGTERIARRAFELARSRGGAPKDGVRRVTVVDKSNVLRSFALFRAVTTEVAAAYPDVELDFRYTDAAAHDLITDPAHFDVVLTENFVGDLLSDLGAATVGGLGMCPSANIGNRHAYFEPVHGSAPSIAGKDRANPTSQILSGAMLLEHLGCRAAADLVLAAVTRTFAEGGGTLDARGCLVDGAEAYVDQVVSRVEAAGATRDLTRPSRAD